MLPSGAGFADRARGAMLLVTELSVQSYARVMQDFSPERMQGMELLGREMIALRREIGQRGSYRQPVPRSRVQRRPAQAFPLHHIRIGMMETNPQLTCVERPSAG